MISLYAIENSPFLCDHCGKKRRFLYVITTREDGVLGQNNIRICRYCWPTLKFSMETKIDITEHVERRAK